MNFRFVLSLLLSMILAVPNFVEARGFSGGSHSFSSHSSFGSSSRSSSSGSSGSRSFSGGTSSKSSSSSTRSGSFSGSSYSQSSRSGTFSGANSTVGRTYAGSTGHGYYNGRSVAYNHYYYAGYSPYSWFGYYHGFSLGMFWGSMFHPWGGVYYVGRQYTDYGPSPIAWILDLIVLGLLIWFGYIIYKKVTEAKTIYRRRF